MRQNISRILIISGAALLLAVCGFYAHSLAYDHMAGRRAQALLDQMMTEAEWSLPPLAGMPHIPSPPPANLGHHEGADSENGPPEAQRPGGGVEAVDDSAENEEAPANGGASGLSDGQAAPESAYSAIGILSIPKLGVRLPVIGECSDELLKISCCRLSGSYDPKPYRLVVAGHNIKSHFKGLETLSRGDEIAFTAINGDTYYYSMTEKTDIHQTGAEDVFAADGWDITLLTCKTDRTMRAMLRFVEVTESGQ